MLPGSLLQTLQSDLWNIAQMDRFHTSIIMVSIGVSRGVGWTLEIGFKVD